MCPREAATMGKFFLTREIELTAVNVADVQWDLEGRCVVWLLPASKNDTSGKGVRRPWGCVCAGVSSKTPCPFCSSLQVREFHLQRGSHGGVPLFCTCRGGRVSKEAAVKTLQKVAELCGQVIMQDGVYLIGGHTLRITGAQHFAGLGLEVYMIQLVGRWGSATVFRYVAEAPLINITEEYNNRVMDKTIHDRCRDMVRSLLAINDEDYIHTLHQICDSMKGPLRIRLQSWECFGP